jgi:hypothetical protein
MSYGISAYRASLPRIKALIGSKDAGMRQRIGIRFADKIADSDEWFGDVPMAEILDDLFSGQINHPDAGYLYHYGVEILIREIGFRLPNDEWYPAKMDVFLNFSNVLTNLIESPFSVPVPDDFPTVLIFEYEKMDVTIAEAATKISGQKQLAQFLDWCKQAMTHEEDLILFYY